MPDILKLNPSKSILAVAIIIFVSSQVYLFYKQRHTSGSTVDTNLKSIQTARQHSHTHIRNALETIGMPTFTLLSTEGAVFSPKEFVKKRFSLLLLFNNLSCSDCVWAALNNLRKYHGEIQKLGGEIVAISDSTTLDGVRMLSKGLHLEFPLLLSPDVNTFFPETPTWKPPVMLLVDANLNKVIYARYEDGINRECEKFIKKALRLYSLDSFE